MKICITTMYQPMKYKLAAADEWKQKTARPAGSLQPTTSSTSLFPCWLAADVPTD
jgi:hypothetical protein